MLRAAFLFVFMLISGLCFAWGDSTAVHVKKPITTDTATVSVRHLDSAALAGYKKLPQFKYTENYSGPSLWSRFWRWFWSWLDLGGKNSGAVSWFWIFIKYLFIALGLASLVILVLKLNGIEMLNLLRKKPYSALAYSESAENIHEIDFDGEIEKALAVNNYRLAVRLLYLKSLKQLSDSSLINWQINKTNTEYVSELNDATQREAFGKLTRQFEYVWYGDFVINADVFKHIHVDFNNFKSNPS